ncbi:hypothetical protein GWI33_019285, partial [Rhynchophorus ferrugineus]
ECDQIYQGETKHSSFLLNNRETYPLYPHIRQVSLITIPSLVQKISKNTLTRVDCGGTLSFVFAACPNASWSTVDPDAAAKLKRRDARPVRGVATPTMRGPTPTAR